MNSEGYSKDYEFSRTSMNEPWKGRVQRARRTLRHLRFLRDPATLSGVLTFDLSQNGANSSLSLTEDVGRPVVP